MSEKAELYRVGRQIRQTITLMPWMLAYAEWLILECIERPKTPMRTARASGLARAPIGKQHIKSLEAREDFQAYCDELRKGPLERARAKFAAAFPTYVEAHADALHSARVAGDYNAVAKLAEPVLDRIYPKKSDAVIATQVNIVLAPHQVAGVRAYEAPPILVQEAEVIAVEASVDSPSDD